MEQPGPGECCTYRRRMRPRRNAGDGHHEQDPNANETIDSVPDADRCGPPDPVPNAEAEERGAPMVSAEAMQARLFEIYDEAAGEPRSPGAGPAAPPADPRAHLVQR